MGVHALRGDVRRVLILAPRIAIDVWQAEIKKHFPFPWYCEDYESEWHHTQKVYAGCPPEVKFFLAGREETFVRRGGKQGPKAKEVEKWDPDLIIADESHEYKRPGGRGAQDLWRLVRRLRKRRASGQPWVILLSGTPSPKGYIDLFSQFRIMDERIFGTNAQDFRDNHVQYHPRKRWTITGYRDEEGMMKKVRRHSYSVSAAEAGMANKMSFQRLNVQLPARAMRMYLELAEEFLTEWEGGVIDAANAGVKRLRLLQIVGGFTTDGQQIHRAKVDSLAAYAKVLLEQEESVVVYSRFTPEVRAAAEALDHVGFRTFRVDGSVPRDTRRLATAALAKRPSTPTAISFQVQAGSRAIELVGAAETVYYSTPDGWVDYWQSMKRTQGPNQPRPVRYTHLVVPGTVDVGSIQGLRRKEDWHQTLMRDPRRYLLGL